MTKPKKEEKETQKTCFVIMPISDPDGYEDGHFGRVYDHIIKPACIAAGLQPRRADEVKSTNYIVIDILKRIIESDIVICDLSSKNPNVLYELGIRQAFNLPSTLIKDNKTDRIFDIQGIRTIDYDDSLRVDTVKKDIATIKATIEETLEKKGKEVNSLIQLLGIHQAELVSSTEISSDTSLILNVLRDVSQRITKLEDKGEMAGFGIRVGSKAISQPNALVAGLNLRKIKQKYEKLETLPNGHKIFWGDPVYSAPGEDLLGYYDGQSTFGVMIKREDGSGSSFIVRPENPNYDTLIGPHDIK